MDTLSHKTRKLSKTPSKSVWRASVALDSLDRALEQMDLPTDPQECADYYRLLARQESNSNLRNFYAAESAKYELKALRIDNDYT
jgi:hypothetical protein